MGEAAACLLRSFPHPSEGSLKAEQGDPIRVFEESISFGRFMSESLAWEKWSSFSKNRYLEEVEKFSKPGSVAQMRAFFEAHYKKKALQRETNFVEETNPQSAIVTLTQTEEKSSPSEFTREKSDEIVDITPEINVYDAELVSSIDANVADSPVDKSLLESSESKEEENEEPEILQTKNPKENEAAIEFSKARNEILESGGEERRLPKERLSVSSLKFGHQIEAASKLPPNPATKSNLRPRQMNDGLSNTMKPIDHILKKARLTATAKSLHSSINFPSGLIKSNERKLAAVSSQNSKPQIGASKRPFDPSAMKTACGQPRQMNNAISKISKPKDNALEKARLPATAKSLHASIDFPSALAKSDKAIAFSQSAARIGPQRDIPRPQKTPLKASETPISKKLPAKSRPNDRRIHRQSASVLDGKRKSSARFSTAPTVSSSFNFKIEERALKRKEKLEEKAMETKKELQTKYKSTSAVSKPSENPRRPPHVRKVVKNGLELCNFSQVTKESAKSFVSNSSYSVPRWLYTTKSDRSEKTRWK